MVWSVVHEDRSGLIFIMKTRVKNTVVFNAQTDFSRRKLNQPYTELVAKYFSEVYGNVEMVVSDRLACNKTQETQVMILKFKDCNIANRVKQSYNGRLLFEVLVYTNFMDVTQYHATGLLGVEFADNPNQPSKKKKKSKTVESKQRDWLMKQGILHKDDDDSFLYPYDASMDYSHHEEGIRCTSSVQYDSVFYNEEDGNETDGYSSTCRETLYPHHSSWQEVQSFHSGGTHCSKQNVRTHKRHYSSSSTSSRSRSHDTCKLATMELDEPLMNHGLGVLHPLTTAEDICQDKKGKQKTVEHDNTSRRPLRQNDSSGSETYRRYSRSSTRKHRRSRRSRERYRSRSRSTSIERKKYDYKKKRYTKYQYSSSSDESIASSRHTEFQQQPVSQMPITTVDYSGVSSTCITSSWSNLESRSRSGTPVMDELSNLSPIITDQPICIGSVQQSLSSIVTCSSCIVTAAVSNLPSSSMTVCSPSSSKAVPSPSSDVTSIHPISVSLSQVFLQQSHDHIVTPTMESIATPSEDLKLESSSPCNSDPQIPLCPSQVVPEVDSVVVEQHHISNTDKAIEKLLQELDSDPPSPLSDKKVTPDVNFHFHKSQILQEYGSSADALVAASAALASCNPQQTEIIRHCLFIGLRELACKLLKKFRAQTGITI